MTGAKTRPDTDTHPNIVMIHCHDLGQYLGCYGNEVDTPHIDRLAASGAQFESYYSTAPQCSPSRGSIMTGKYPHRTGLLGLAHMGWELNEDETTLPMYLNGSGYTTMLLGFQHEVSWDEPERLGYDIVDTESTHALDLSERFQNQIDILQTEAPFFVSIGFTEPHRDYRVDYIPDAKYETTDPDDIKLPPYLPDRPGIREDIVDLQTLISSTVDKAVGEVVKTIKAQNIEKETLVIFTTDHGIAMPRAKGTCYDPGIRTALIMHLPEQIDSNQIHDPLLSNVDLLPTILDIVGMDPPSDIDGKSFRPLLEENKDSTRDRIFTEMTWHDGYNPIRSVRTKQHKYIRNFWLSPSVFLPTDIFQGKAGREVREEYYTTFRPVEELYDLRKDPYEQNNLASNRRIYETIDDASDPDPNYDEILEALRDDLRNWMINTDDPLLDGPVPISPPQEDSRDNMW